jgi:RNA polymerase sigma-70 factor (ECF subfamily)
MLYSEKSTADMPSIIDAIRNGDVAAFRRLYDLFHAQLYVFALKFLKSPQLAEEVVHDVFLKVWEKRSTLDSSKNIQSYLFATCKNTVLNTLKKAAYDTQIQQQIAAHFPTFEDAAFHEISHIDNNAILWEAIQQLPAQRQQVFRLSKFEELSYEEIAQRLGIAKGTVSDHLVKAMRSVRTYMYAKSGELSVVWWVILIIVRSQIY